MCLLRGSYDKFPIPDESVKSLKKKFHKGKSSDSSVCSPDDNEGPKKRNLLTNLQSAPFCREYPAFCQSLPYSYD